MPGGRQSGHLVKGDLIFEMPRHFMQMGSKDWAKGWRKELPKYRLGNGVKHT
jgi:hypothetical protein